MGRRKKEPENVHRKNMAAAAERLFMEYGMENISMNDIAKAAGYSKATLYVYFKNKEELVGALVSYQEEYPFYFEILQKAINIDFESDHFLPEEKETFFIGEQLNGLLADFLKSGIERGEIRPDIEILPAIFSFWGMLSGLIQIAVNKEAYISQEMGRSKKEFLEYGFEMLYASITVNGREK